jgi:hypothetical protein
MPRPTIARGDLQGVLERHRGNEALRAAFQGAADPARLLTVLARYIHFNSAFGPGVANLAGEIGARPALFRDPEQPARLLADRAAEVASDFFYAAVDEFDDRATPWRDAHRTLAQATLEGAARFFGFAPARLDEAVRINAATLEAMARVSEGYGIGARLDDRRLFAGMGFHVGSEVLADREFVIIDHVLREKHPALVAALEAMRVPALDEKHNAYYWVRIHTGVEAEHFDAALSGANKALRFYAGPDEPEAVKGFILEGFARFASVQADFMAGLAEA